MLTSNSHILSDQFCARTPLYHLKAMAGCDDSAAGNANFEPLYSFSSLLYFGLLLPKAICFDDPAGSSSYLKHLRQI